MNFRFLSLLTFVLMIVASSCKKSRNANFPNVRVDEFVYLSNPSNFQLSSPGGWVYNQGGYRGLIIYRRFINGDQSDFAAYDRACPEHYSRDCSVLQVDADGIYAECSCNNERYLLLDGSPADGAQLPLIEYQTFLNGQVLNVSN